METNLVIHSMLRVGVTYTTLLKQNAAVFTKRSIIFVIQTIPPLSLSLSAYAENVSTPPACLVYLPAKQNAPPSQQENIRFSILLAASLGYHPSPLHILPTSPLPIPKLVPCSLSLAGELV